MWSKHSLWLMLYYEILQASYNNFPTVQWIKPPVFDLPTCVGRSEDVRWLWSAQPKNCFLMVCIKMIESLRVLFVTDTQPQNQMPVFDLPTCVERSEDVRWLWSGSVHGLYIATIFVHDYKSALQSLLYIQLVICHYDSYCVITTTSTACYSSTPTIRLWSERYRW